MKAHVRYVVDVMVNKGIHLISTFQEMSPG